MSLKEIVLREKEVVEAFREKEASACVAEKNKFAKAMKTFEVHATKAL